MARKSWHFLWLLLLCGLLSASAGSSTNAQNGPASQYAPQTKAITLPKDLVLPIVLPYQTWNGLIVVLGSVGAAAERFVLSSGMNANTVSDEIYKRFQLQALESHIRVNVLDSAEAAQEVQFKTLRFRSMVLENFRAGLLDVYPIISRGNRPDAPQCWLGTPFFAAFQVTIDFSGQFVILSSTEAKPLSVPGAITVPLLVREGRLWVNVAAPPARPFLALLDTSATGTLIPSETAAKLKIAPLKVTTISRKSGVLGKAGLVMLPKLSVGKAELKSVPAIFMAQDSPPEFDTKLAVLGTDFLRHFKVIINVAQKKLILAPLSKPTDTAPADSDDPNAPADDSAANP